MPGAAPGAAVNGGPPHPGTLPPAGRGRGATLPAWMTSAGGAPAAPGGLPGPPPMAPGRWVLAGLVVDCTSMRVL
jgi:hypothetical protein